MTDNFILTSLPIQILHRPMDSLPSKWHVLETGPGKFVCPESEFLGLRVRNIGDEFLSTLVAEFRSVSNLIMLNLSENRKVTDKGIRIIQPLKELQELNLSSCDLSNRGMELLLPLVHLKNLNISYCNRLTGDGLLFLRKLNHLEFLDLQGLPKINTGDIARLRRPTLKIHRP
jgi:Leucine Rich repeat